MYRGTLTPNNEGGFDMSFKNCKGGIVDFAVKAAITAAMGALSYAGQYAMAKIIQKNEERKYRKAQEG